MKDTIQFRGAGFYAHDSTPITIVMDVANDRAKKYPPGLEGIGWLDN